MKTRILSIVLLALSTSVAMAQQPLPKHVAGKVIAVSQEKVQTAPNQWADQIKVKVDSCQQRGKIEEVVYNPATISDRTALGHLFEENHTSAWTPLIEVQQSASIGGYGLFWVDDSNKVLRTGILGSGVDCKAVPTLLQQVK